MMDKRYLLAELNENFRKVWLPQCGIAVHNKQSIVNERNRDILIEIAEDFEELLISKFATSICNQELKKHKYGSEKHTDIMSYREAIVDNKLVILNKIKENAEYLGLMNMNMDLLDYVELELRCEIGTPTLGDLMELTEDIQSL